MRLAKNRELTGEWPVYAQHEGRNLYLCLGAHDKDAHDELCRQIGLICCQEFAFLAALLEKA